jgi:quinohemoprotein ethanol dehydrogenase
VQVQAFNYSQDTTYVYNKGGRNLGVNAAPGALPRDPNAPPPINSWLSAWDPVEQKERWRVEFARGSGGGTLSTAGNLVFQPDAEGNLVAYNAATGAKLWSAPVGAGAATPMSYSLDGKQYIAILAGRGGNGPSHMVAFALAE